MNMKMWNAFQLMNNSETIKNNSATELYVQGCCKGEEKLF